MGAGSGWCRRILEHVLLSGYIERGKEGCAPAAVVGWAAEAPLHRLADPDILILDERCIVDCLRIDALAGVIARA